MYFLRTRFSLFVGLWVCVVCAEGFLNMATVQQSSKVIPGKREKQVSPEQRAGLCQLVMFSWMNSLFTLARTKRKNGDSLDLDDLYAVVETDSSARIQGVFDAAYDKHRAAAQANSGASPKEQKRAMESALIAGLKAVGYERTMRAGVLKIFNTMLQFLYPICVNGILQFIETGASDPDVPKYVGFLWAVGLGTAMLFKAFTENGYFHLQQRVSWQVRTALQTAVYKKSIEISAASRQTQSVGQIVNLMQLDSTRVEMFVSNLHMIWDGAFQIIGYMTILVVYMGPSALVGLLVMILSMPAQGILMKRIYGIQRKMVKEQDARVKMTNEAFQGIQCVKFYAWEEPLMKVINTFREQEVGFVKDKAYATAASRSFMSAVPAVAAAAAFSVYALTGGIIRASVLFTVLQGFGQLRFPLMFYPMTLASLATAKVALGRVAEFYGMDNVQNYVTKTEGDAPAIKIVDGEFWWQAPVGDAEAAAVKEAEQQKKPSGTAQAHPEKEDQKKAASAVLADISIELQKSQLLGVVGPVGCGKSSLVNAILGEMVLTKGTVSVNGSVAYCGQTPWILNASVKDNILFGEEYDEARYLTCLKACELESDMRVLENGDATMIGERGINLSGVQKQRVSLARAAYSGRDLYLFDDPLSALDPAVANKVFDACLLTLLNGKSRLLVTNQLQFLSRCDSVAVMKTVPVEGETEASVGPGRISEYGTYNELMDNDGEFCNLMKKSGETEAVSNAQAEDGASNDAPGSPGGRPSRTKSLGSVLTEKAIGAKALMEKEEKNSGSISWSVYTSYIVAAGGWCTFIAVFLWYIVVVLVQFMSTAWISIWTLDAPDYKSQTFAFYVGGMVVIAVLVAVFVYIRAVIIAMFGLNASKRLHSRLLRRILKAPMSFFDTTPIGRLVNRFSGDLNTIDDQLIMFLDFTLWCGIMMIMTFTVITFATPWFAVAFPFMFAAYYSILDYFRSVYLGAKRLDSISKSPVYAHFSETLGGLSTVRAYGLGKVFMGENHAKVDTNVGAYYLTKACDRWLSVRLEVMGAFVAMLSSVLAVWSTMGALPISSSIAGLSVYYAASTSGILSWFVRQFAALENALNSVERIEYYSANVAQESTDNATDVDPDWPQKGAIEIANLNMRYREGLPLVLDGMDVSIKGGSRVGIVGRTGCGKSSLMLALLRMVEPERHAKSGGGPIRIDDVDTMTVAHKDIRSRIGIIPQNPTLFSGTIRSNLDPFGQYTDADLWDALDKCGLSTTVKAMVTAEKTKSGRSEVMKGLDSSVAEYGENMSQGQRQLLCLGRVLLKKCKILLLDEATSSVDFETDARIQATLREAFVGTTILTIAHRVNTIMDSDLILVLDKGTVSESGTPTELLAKDGGEFKEIVEASQH